MCELRAIGEDLHFIKNTLISHKELKIWVNQKKSRQGWMKSNSWSKNTREKSDRRTKLRIKV